MKKWFIPFAILTLVACNHETVETNEVKQQLETQEPSIIEMDYSKLEEAIPNVLQKMNYQIDVLLDKDIQSMELAEFFSVEKTAFRMNVENEMANVLIHNNVKQSAEEQVARYLQAISIAEKKYDVTVSQEEVTAYIDQHIAPIEMEEKNRFASALGISREELDYVFDRDFYIMDTLWEKLIPVLQEKHPGLSSEEIKEQFYNEF